MVSSRVALLVVALSASVFLSTFPVQAQSVATPPDFVVGPNKSYCHVTDATNTIWMNTLEDDGDGVPYEIYGEPAFTDPALGAGQDPVVDEDFETRIPLSPALAQDLVLEGTVTVQAYIGGGTYTVGRGSIGTSLVAGGAVLGEAAAKTHQMAPSQAGATYTAISWTFDVSSTTVPAGTLLEWVISGSASGNNVFLACHEARGRSYIELPIVSAAGGAGTVIEHQLNGTAGKITLSAAEPTNATHVYSWTTNLTTLQLDILGGVASGNLTISILDGANATVHNGTYTGNVSQEVTAAAGNWTFTVTLESFTGNLTIEAGPLKPETAPGSESGTGTRPATSTTSGTQDAGNGTAKDDEGSKDTPATALPALLGAVAAAVILARRRR